jgi:hypothetical protein
MREQERSGFTGERLVALRVQRQPLVSLFNRLFENAVKQELETLPLIACHG